MITAREQKALDLNSEYFGTSILVLMENAGKGMAAQLRKRREIKNKIVHIYAGPGGNGGDGFVACRHLKEAKRHVFVLGEPREEALYNYNRMSAPCTHVKSKADLPKNKPDIIIDAIFGTGITGPIREPYKSAISLINRTKAYKVSIDIPSGKNPDTGKGLGVRPNLIVSLHDRKPGFPKAVVVPIGIPPKAHEYCGPGDVFLARPLRPKSSHKGQNGIVLTIAGSELFTGAPVLAANAALSVLRTGTDLSLLAAPSRVADIAATNPDLITIPLEGSFLNPSHLSKLTQHIKKSTTILLGPGIGTESETGKFVNSLLRRIGKKPIVMDADALKLVDPSLLKAHNTILTPHKREFEILSGSTSSAEQVKRFAHAHKTTILRKGQVDVITDGEKLKYNSTGSPGMSKGGSGDVLAGLLAGLLSQRISNFQAACGAAHINGRAGEILEKEMGYGFLASDLLKQIPRILYS